MAGMIRRQILVLWTIGAIGTLVTLGISAIAWSHVHAPIAVHYGPDGPDRYAGKAFGLLAVPVTLLAGTALVSASEYLRALRPRGRSALRAAPVAWLVAAVLLVCIHVSLVLSALQTRPDPLDAGRSSLTWTVYFRRS